MPFDFRRLSLPEVILIEAQAFPDERGFFMETYKRTAFAEHGLAAAFVQENHSRSGYGVLRGLHYQLRPHAQGKLVRAVVGEIFDVAVDIREGSPTYGQWVAERLSADNRRMLYVPEGFAHGFCVLSEVAEVVYKTTSEYAPESEAGILWNDRAIGIDWPVERPILSPRDAALPPLREARNNFVDAERREDSEEAHG